MILSRKTLYNFRKNQKIYRVIADELNMTEGNVRRIVAANEPNNDMTKITVIEIIKRKTGLRKDEILKEVK